MNAINKSLLLMMVLFVAACTDPWNDHVKINDSTADQTLMQILEQRSELSTFVNALKTTGLDEELSTMQLFTIWAPTNDALAPVDDNILNNEDSLTRFISNHIAQGKHNYDTGAQSEKIKMHGGKFLLINQNSKMIDEVTVSDSYNLPAKNGVIHILNEPIELRPNIWQYIESLGSLYEHTAYLNSLSGVVFDPDIAEQIGWTDDGQPIYDTITGSVWQNSFLENVADLRSEDSTFTMFVVEDAVYFSEFEKFRPYYKAFSGNTAQDSLKNIAVVKRMITKDYVASTAYAANELPSEVFSTDSVFVPVSQSAVVSSFKASNGYVHILSACDIPLGNKIQEIYIEGESFPRWFAEGGNPAGYKRKRENARGGFDYILDNHNNSSVLGGLILHAGEVASTRYRYYLKAINDFNASYRYPKPTLDPLTQSLATVVLQGINAGEYVFGPPAVISGAEAIPVTDSTYVDATEVMVGTTNFTTMRDLYLQLIATGNGQAVVVDYIKMVPVFE